MTLTAAAAETGVGTVSVTERHQWSIEITPSGSGTRLRILYAAAATDWQITRLLEKYQAIRTGAGAAIAISRKTFSPNQAGFQLLLKEDELC